MGCLWSPAGCGKNARVLEWVACSSDPISENCGEILGSIMRNNTQWLTLTLLVTLKAITVSHWDGKKNL